MPTSGGRQASKIVVTHGLGVAATGDPFYVDETHRYTIALLDAFVTTWGADARLENPSRSDTFFGNRYTAGSPEAWPSGLYRSGDFRMLPTWGNQDKWSYTDVHHDNLNLLRTLGFTSLMLWRNRDVTSPAGNDYEATALRVYDLLREWYQKWSARTGDFAKRTARIPLIDPKTGALRYDTATYLEPDLASATDGFGLVYANESHGASSVMTAEYALWQIGNDIQDPLAPRFKASFQKLRDGFFNTPYRLDADGKGQPGGFIETTVDEGHIAYVKAKGSFRPGVSSVARSSRDGSRCTIGEQDCISVHMRGIPETYLTAVVANLVFLNLDGAIADQQMTKLGNGIVYYIIGYDFVPSVLKSRDQTAPFGFGLPGNRSGTSGGIPPNYGWRDENSGKTVKALASSVTPYAIAWAQRRDVGLAFVERLDELVGNTPFLVATLMFSHAAVVDATP